MPVYRVSIWAAYEVEALSEEAAQDAVHDLVLAGEIPMKEYEFDAELTDHDEPLNY